MKDVKYSGSGMSRTGSNGQSRKLNPSGLQRGNQQVASSGEQQNPRKAQELEILTYSRGRGEEGVKNRKIDCKSTEQTNKPSDPLLNVTARWLPLPYLGHSREIYLLEKWDQRSAGLEDTRNSRREEETLSGESLYPEKRDLKASPPSPCPAPESRAVKSMSPQQETEGLLSS